MIPPLKALYTTSAVQKGGVDTEIRLVHSPDEKWHCLHNALLKCLAGLFGASFLQVSAAVAVLEIYRFE